MKNLLKCW